MGSDRNKMTDGTGVSPSHPTLCANGCGFFGTVATMGLCSKCYRDLCTQDDREASTKAAIDNLSLRSPRNRRVEVDLQLSAKPVVPPTIEVGADSLAAAPAAAANRCLTCNKKVGVMEFKCRCGRTYCMAHRYPEKHDCTFDYKSEGRDAIAKANPVIKADKIQRF